MPITTLDSPTQADAEGFGTPIQRAQTQLLSVTHGYTPFATYIHTHLMLSVLVKVSSATCDPGRVFAKAEQKLLAQRRLAQ